MSEESLSDEMMLNYHLMHPGGDSRPGDPNLAYYLNGTYHLHYILKHRWCGPQVPHAPEGESFSFVHVTSPDMINWTWQKTKLQPSFTGHGMFSGTGFITKEGKAAGIYCGVSDPRQTFIVTAEDDNLDVWNKPYPVLPKGGPDGKDMRLVGDPDLFTVGETYYAYSASDDVQMCKSKNLVDWEYVGPLMKNGFSGVAIGEDLSCANMFPFFGKWMLLNISHFMGCRYYIGDWDEEAEQFVPESHGRMNWRRPEQSLENPEYRDFFAPESVLTPDGRRVMWAWLATIHPDVNLKTVQSLPRELSLHEDGALRIEPLQELTSLRYDRVAYKDIVYTVNPSAETDILDDKTVRGTKKIADLPGDSFEIEIVIERSRAEGKRFGFHIFADDDNEGLFFLMQTESGTIRLGEVEAPFDLSDVPGGEALRINVFGDKYLVEVFVNGRQALITTFMDYNKGQELRWYLFAGGMSFSANIWDTTAANMHIRKIDIWKLKCANEGLVEARDTRVWEPDNN